MWWLEWLSSLRGGAATLVGAATAGGILLVAVMLAVLYNARQTRLRDSRLRAQEAKALATALKSELRHIAKALREHILDLRDQPSSERGFRTPDLQRSTRIFPHMLDKLSLLDGDTLQAALGAYTLVDEYKAQIVAIVGTDLAKEIENKGVIVKLPSSMTSQIISASDQVIKVIEVALGYLDGYENKSRSR